MATYTNRIALLYIQWRRRYAQRRLLRDMGWRDYWTVAAQTRRF